MFFSRSQDFPQNHSNIFGVVNHPPTRRRARCSFIQRAWLFCVISISLSLVSTGCYPSSEPSDHSPTAIQVEVISLRKEPHHAQIRLIGKIEPTQEVTMYFEVSGVVKEVHVSEGTDVKQDDPIAELFPEDYQLALQQANARRDAAQARLDLLLAGTRLEEREAARAELDRTEALREFWNAEYIRQKKLFDNGRAITESDLHQAKSQRDAAVAAQVVAKARNELAINGPRKEEIAEARAAHQEQVEAVAIAARQLAKTSLKAPFAGRIEMRLVDVGDYVNVFPTGGVPVVQLIDLSHADAVVSVPESLVTKFKQGGVLRISSAWHEEQPPGANDQMDRSVIGTITSVGQIADTTTGTYEVRARLPNAGRHFSVGMTVIATLHLAQSQQELRLPASSVRYAFGQSPYVFTVSPESGVVNKREIRLGTRVANDFVVTEGLEPGELLIVAGQHRTVEGDRVEFKKIDSPILRP